MSHIHSATRGWQIQSQCEIRGETGISGVVTQSLRKSFYMEFVHHSLEAKNSEL